MRGLVSTARFGTRAHRWPCMAALCGPRGERRRIAAMAQVLRQAVALPPAAALAAPLVGNCATGLNGAGSFNFSTAVAFVPRLRASVAKHGKSQCQRQGGLRAGRARSPRSSTSKLRQCG